MYPELRIPIDVEYAEEFKMVLKQMLWEVVDDVGKKHGSMKEWMSIQETCDALGVSQSTLLRWRHNLGLKACTVEGKVFFSRDTLTEFLKRYEE